MTVIYQSDSAIFEFPEEDLPFIILEFLKTGRGSVTCKTCNINYQASELKHFVVGHGSSPFTVNLKQRGGIKSLFKKKQRLPGMFGGRGYKCPKGHELISMILWET